jgi:hypothetical protein
MSGADDLSRQISESNDDHAMKLNLKAVATKRFRRLKWNERVSLGDFVRNEHRRFELWQGPGGFRADSFVQPIYRRDKSRLTATKQLK